MTYEPCNRPRCPEFVKTGTGGYCSSHKPRRDQDPVKRKLYNSQRWRGPNGIRVQQLRRQPLCELNEKCVDPEPATHVHHVDGDTGNNHASNLQSMCNPCHTWWETQYGAMA